MTFVELATALAVSWSALGDTVVCHNDPEPSTISKPDSGYAVQYLFPGWSQSGWVQLERWGFVNNDPTTLWPGAGAIVLPDTGGGFFEFPTPQQLQDAILVGPFQGPELDVTLVDLTNEWVATPPFTNWAVVLVLKIPPGTPVEPGVGPGVLLADKLGTDCSFYTLDGGLTWYGLTQHEWAWAGEFGRPTTSDVLPVTRAPWGRVKELFR